MKRFRFDPSDFELIDNQTHYAVEKTHDWAASQVFSFNQSYPCPKCASSDRTLFDRIARINDTQTVYDAMSKVLMVRSPKPTPVKHFKAALDVFCSPQVKPEDPTP